ncbi:helix-turn-helix domain-containing protein [Pirellulaceae bacterium SH449]
MANEENSKPTSRRQIARLIGSSPLPIYVLSDDDVVVFANEAAGQYFSIPAEELIGLECSVVAAQRTELGSQLGLPLDWDRNQVHLVADATKGGVRLLLPIEIAGASGRATIMVVIVPEGTAGSIRELDWSGLQIRQSIREVYSQLESDQPWHIVGSSPGVKFARRQIQIATKASFPVLITGSPGAFRESLATFLHRSRLRHRGSRSAMPPVVIDCGLMDHSLLTGMFELILERRGSNGMELGVVLKDLDRLSAELIPTLVTFLVNHSAMELYATAEQVPDLKGVAPTSELWNRVASFLVSIPRLSERKEDLRELVHGWFEQNQKQRSSELRDETKGIALEFQSAPEFYDALEAYPWRGDLVEFESAVAQAFKEADGKVLLASHLPISIRTSTSELEEARVFSPIDLDRVLEETERHLTLGALEHAKGNRSAAAKLLNVSRARLIRRLQQWGLDRESPETPDEDLPKFEEIT